MKVFLIHGDDLVKSHERLGKFIAEAKKRNWEVLFIDDSNLAFAEAISSASLFSTDRFLVHRDFKKLAKLDLNFLFKKSDLLPGNLVLYSDSEVPKSLISKLPQSTKVEEFKLPFPVWKFLDSFYPGNGKTVINMLHEIIESEPIEFIFGLLARLLRDLYWVNAGLSTLKYQPWRLNKLKVQSEKFKGNLLELIISELAEADIKSKTSSESLVSLLDFIIISKLEYSQLPHVRY